MLRLEYEGLKTLTAGSLNGSSKVGQPRWEFDGLKKLVTDSLNVFFSSGGPGGSLME